jgi:hypothetical protein
MSGEVQADIGDAHRAARAEIEVKVNQLLRTNAYGGESITEWAFLAIIMAVEDPQFGEVAKLHRKRGVAEFRLRVPHADFKAASEAERRRMLLRSLIRSVSMMPDIGVRDLDAPKLIDDLHALGLKEGWL